MPSPGVGLSWCLPGGIPAGAAAASPRAQPFAHTPRPGEFLKTHRVAHLTPGGADREEKHWLTKPWQVPERQLPLHLSMEKSSGFLGGVLCVLVPVSWACSGARQGAARALEQVSTWGMAEPIVPFMPSDSWQEDHPLNQRGDSQSGALALRSPFALGQRSRAALKWE